MTTGVVPMDSDLVRRRWMREGMIQAASQSFWSTFTGTSKDAVVYQVNDERAEGGHTVVFDYDGNLSGKAIKGKNRAYGKGEVKRKFSDKVTVERYRIPVDNGDKFDGKNIGDLSINEHTDSRRRLGDLWIRWKDQGLFDAAQGNLDTLDEGLQAPTHVIDLGSTFTYNSLVDIEKTLKTSVGFTTGGIRAPLQPYSGTDTKPLWYMMLDSHAVAKLKKDNLLQQLLKDADVRGERNRLISGYLGRIGHLAFIEAPSFFGYTDGDGAGWGLDDSEVEIAGMRLYDKTNDAWQGQEGFDFASALQSNSFIVGRGALQLAMGKSPDYRFQESDDFAISSESAVEFWLEMRKSKYKQDAGRSYKQAQVAGVDHGIVTVTIDL